MRRECLPGHAAERGASYGEAAAVCPICHRKLRIEIDTDGNGGMIETVESCPVCTPRRSRIIVKRPDERQLVCEKCDRTFTRARQTGRLPRFCPSCL